MEKINRIGIGTGNFGINGVDERKSIELIKVASENSKILLDTADFYGSGTSEMIIGKALKECKRENVKIIAKYGAMMAPTKNPGLYGGEMYGLDVNPFRIKNYLIHSMKRMGVDYIDVYMPARMDNSIPVEDIIEELSKLVKEGYIKEIGLTQVDSKILERAEKIHHISYVESNYSLLNREIEEDLIPTTIKNGTDIAAFGVLAHGMLSERILTAPEAPKSRMEIFKSGNFEENIKIVKKLSEIAKEKNSNISELAIAWSLKKYENIYTVIGMTNTNRYHESMKALELELTDEEIKNIEKIVSDIGVRGRAFPNVIFENGKILRVE